MPLFSGLFEHRGSEILVREQASFYIREVQNSILEMGKLLKEIVDAGHSDISLQCSRLQQLNTQVGTTLEQVQKALR